MQSRPVLVIDDDHQRRELVAALLTTANFQVIAAPDGPQGIELARARQPAVIILDLHLAGMDGLGTLAALKRDPHLKPIPVVAVTASPDLTYRDKAFHAGALLFLFLPEPFTGSSLLRAVELALNATRPLAKQERRHHPRLPAIIPVECSVVRQGRRDLAGRTENVSLGGVLLMLPEALPAGTAMHLRLALPEGLVTATGTVRWQQTRATNGGEFSHGVELTRFEGAAVEYRRYVTQLGVRSTSPAPQKGGQIKM